MIQMQNLKEKEERFRFLLSKIEAEVSKFKEINEELNKKKTEIMKFITKSGAENVTITLSSDNQENISELVSAHLLELENLRNYIAGELQKIVKEEELLEMLSQKYNDKISIEETEKGSFKIKYNDEDIDNAILSTNLSKKLVQSLKDTTLKQKQSE